MKKIGIICAMESEAAAVRKRLTETRETRAGVVSITMGRFGEKEVFVGLAGMGKVAAAVCTQAIIDAFHPDAIINCGVAGCLTEKLDILDVALSTALVQHDMDTTPLGDPIGYLSGPGLIEIPADRDLLAAAERAAAELGIRTLSGLIASGDQFIAQKAQKEKILSHFPAIACEMEGAAVAQAAFLNGVPVLVLRAISDAFVGDNAMDFAAFAPRAAEQSGALVTRMLDLLK